MEQGNEDDYNPYAPPAPGQGYGFTQPHGAGSYGAGSYGAEEEEYQLLASRGTRLGARIIDSLLMMATLVPFVMAVMSIFDRSSGNQLDYDPSATAAPYTQLFSAVTLASLLPILALQIYQWYLIAREGQTLGKRWLGIKIIKQDGSAVDFVSGVILREWVLGAAGAIPYIGNFVGFIDAVMIFGDQQLCLHDHIARTKVIVKLNQV